MKKVLKYGVVSVVAGSFLLCTTVLLLPVLFNVQKILPQIEKQVTRATGRPFSVGADFGLTFFPWLSVTFSDMSLGNPEGIVADDFIHIDSFEARVKLLPLLMNRLELSRFVVSGLNVNLQREQDGRNNWDILLVNDGPYSSHNISSVASWLLSREFFIELFAITGGSLTWNDKQHETSHRLDDLMLLFNNVSSTGTAQVDFKVRAGQQQLSGVGSIGPISARLSSLALDLQLQVNEQIEAFVKGDCSYPLDKTQCDLLVNMPPFSLLALSSGAEGDKTDAQATRIDGLSIELAGHFQGNQQKFSVDSGEGTFDDTSFTYQLIHDPSQQMTNQVKLNFKKIHLDRYFEPETGASENLLSKIAYPFFKRTTGPSFLASIQGDELFLANVHCTGVKMDISGENGRVNIKKGKFVLHGGTGAFSGTVGLNDLPVSFAGDVELQQVQTKSFSKELLGTSFLSGLMDAQLALQSRGLPGSAFTQGFTGDGTIRIADGYISGIDLLSAKTVSDAKNTEFTSLSAGISMEPGVVRLSPLVLTGGRGKTMLSVAIQLADHSFAVSPYGASAGNEELFLSGSYGSDGLVVPGDADVQDTKMYGTRDAQTLVDAKMPMPMNRDIKNMAGTPLIDPAIVAQRFGLQPLLISQKETKKAFNVGKGRVKIHRLQQLNSPAFVK